MWEEAAQADHYTYARLIDNRVIEKQLLWTIPNETENVMQIFEDVKDFPNGNFKGLMYLQSF